MADESKSTIDITDSEFNDRVLNSDLPVVVDFWAPWCGPCRMIAPILQQLAQEYEGRLVVAKVNTDENPLRAQQYGIMGIPTMLFFDKGKEVDRAVGALPKPALRTKFEELLAREPAAS